MTMKRVVHAHVLPNGLPMSRQGIKSTVPFWSTYPAFTNQVSIFQINSCLSLKLKCTKNHGRYPLDLANSDCWNLILATETFSHTFCAEWRPTLTLGVHSDGIPSRSVWSGRHQANLWPGTRHACWHFQPHLQLTSLNKTNFWKG